MNLSEHEMFAAYRTIAEAARTRRIKGQPIPGWMRGIETRFEREVVVSRLGRRSETERAHSDQDVRISAREAGEILGLSKRQVHRIAEDLDGEIIDGRWLFRKSVVEAYAEERRHGSAGEGIGGG